MIKVDTPFEEVFILKPNVYLDKRGSFKESFNSNIFQKLIDKKIVFLQDNEAFSKKGALRGLHFQLPPFSQSKLVRVIQGTIMDVVLDIRRGSSTFGKYFSQELSAENQLQLFIPRGFAHGYITLSKTSIFAYKVDNYYNLESERSINPEDPSLGIDWQLPKREWIQSKKDQKYPNLEKATLFDYNLDPYD